VEFKHISVLLEESVDMLNINPSGIYVDGTLGGGGHAELVCSRLNSDATFIGIDRDRMALAAAGKRLEKFGDMVSLVHSNYADIKQVLAEKKIDKIDGAILDLGVSSPQLDIAERGFSYNMDAKLDMRMDTDSDFSAYNVVNEYSREKLAEIISKYGEERYAMRIASNIVAEREKKPIETTFELSEIIKKSMPAKSRFGDKHPAKRTFQAIRIEVNRELELLEGAVMDFADVLKPGGVLAIITFHSLEDRIVKNVFSKLASGCECPKDFPICVCGKTPKVKLVSKKPVISGSEELENNFRAHSAKLRGIIKL